MIDPASTCLPLSCYLVHVHDITCSLQPLSNMAEPTPLTGLQTSGSVSSRFVSQNELDEAKKRKDEEWKAAYAR